MSYGDSSFTVTQLNEYVKMLIDSDEVLQTAAVVGEISNFKHHYATGHLYFSLKDDRSVVKCVMFARDASRLRFTPENGMTVTVWGRVSVFPRDGAYQLYVGFMSPLGLGEQLAAFEQLKKKLSDEGLFDQARKRPIPGFPKRIGIVTSQTGAAIRDLQSILERRWPVGHVILYPALVQGAGAPASLCAGIEYFNNRCPVDVIIVGRGGGSGEDLSAFNDEKLARTIASSAIPVISAVGHESDVSISDFVADLRAPTPSAAAELAVPDMSEYSSRINALCDRIRSMVAGKIENCEEMLSALSSSAVLTNPMRFFELREMEFIRLSERLDSSYHSRVAEASAEFSANVAKLEALSPLAVLSRGYGIVEKDGHTLSSVSHVVPGDKINVVMRDGSAEAEIINVKFKK